MGSVGVLVFFAVMAAVVCAKARFAGGAVLFSLVALILFVATPAGQALPAALGRFVASVDDVVTPVLTGDRTR